VPVAVETGGEVVVVLATLEVLIVAEVFDVAMVDDFNVLDGEDTTIDFDVALVTGLDVEAVIMVELDVGFEAVLLVTGVFAVEVGAAVDEAVAVGEGWAPATSP
jgi:hypothetical protein